MVRPCSTSSGDDGSVNPLAPCASIAHESIVATTATARPSDSSRRSLGGIRRRSITCHTRPTVTDTATRAVGSVNHDAPAVRSRSPTRKPTRASTIAITMALSTTSRLTSRWPDRARIIDTPAAPNSRMQGRTPATASCSSTGLGRTMITSSATPFRQIATTPPNQRRQARCWYEVCRAVDHVTSDAGVVKNALDEDPGQEERPLPVDHEPDGTGERQHGGDVDDGDRAETRRQDAVVVRILGEPALRRRDVGRGGSGAERRNPQRHEVDEADRHRLDAQQRGAGEPEVAQHLCGDAPRVDRHGDDDAEAEPAEHVDMSSVARQVDDAADGKARERKADDRGRDRQPGRRRIEHAGAEDDDDDREGRGSRPGSPRRRSGRTQHRGCGPRGPTRRSSARSAGSRPG